MGACPNGAFSVVEGKVWQSRCLLGCPEKHRHAFVVRSNLSIALISNPLNFCMTYCVLVSREQSAVLLEQSRYKSALSCMLFPLLFLMSMLRTQKMIIDVIKHPRVLNFFLVLNLVPILTNSFL